MPKQLTFEQALAKLEETVRRLEEGNTPLDQAVALFEEGTRLARLCNEYLDAAELKVKQLVQASDGEYREQSIELDSDAGTQGSGA